LHDEEIAWLEDYMRERPPHTGTDKDRKDDPYESDRRGEHQYPDDAKHDAERPSQREREELKERLEKRG